MKKVFLASFSILFAISAFSQKDKVIAANNHMGNYAQGGSPTNLVEAAKDIDIATQDSITGAATKTWWIRSQIYLYISSDTTLRTKYPTASIESFKSFQKMKAINDPKFKDWEDAVNNMVALVSNLFNDAVDAFKAKQYTQAYQFFSSVGDLADLITEKGGKVKPEVVNQAFYNAGVAAENGGDLTGAVAVYIKMLPTSTEAKIYTYLINDEIKLKNIGEARKYTDEGLVKYPTDKSLMKQKINFYMSDGKYADGITYIKSALTQDPTNESLQALLGISYGQINDTANAKKIYTSLLAQNPDNFEANYGMGTIYHNMTHALQDSMNAINGITKEDNAKYEALRQQRNALFNQAAVYLNKALAYKKANPKVKDVEPTQDYIQGILDRMAVLLKQ